MRAPFNTTADFFAGPGQPNAGDLRGTADVRLVLADGIFQDSPFAPTITAWCTVEDVQPVGGWTPIFQGWRASLGDTVAHPHGATPGWYVVHVEVINWRMQDEYYRALLAPLPRGPDTTVGPHLDLCIQELRFIALGFQFNVVDEITAVWRRLTDAALPVGTYHFTLPTPPDSVTIRVFQAPDVTGCELTEMTITEDAGCYEFVITEELPTWVLLQDIVSSASWDIAFDAGTCP